MNIDEIPDGVFWARFGDDAAGRAHRAIRSATNPERVIAFGPREQRCGGYGLGSEADTLSALGYATEGLGRNRGYPSSFVLAEQPADAEPLPMRPGFADPAIAPLPNAEHPEMRWVVVTRGTQNLRAGRYRSLALRHPDGRDMPVAFGDEEDLGCHNKVADLIGESWVARGLREHGYTPEVYFLLGTSSIDWHYEDTEPTTQPATPQPVTPADSITEAHRRDVAAIYHALAAQAERRGWGHHLNAMVADLNPRLAVPLVPTERYWDVTYTETRVTAILSAERPTEAQVMAVIPAGASYTVQPADGVAEEEADLDF